MIFTIIFIAVYVALNAADYLSTKANNKHPEIVESNRRYRLPDGRADLPKLLREKLIVGGVICVAALALAMTEASFLGALAPFVGSLVLLPTVLKNYRLNKKYQGD